MAEAKSYGVPYKGSKNRLAEQLVKRLPPAGTLIDVFAGGCAVTHAAMLARQYEKYIVNDFDGKGVECFLRAVNGEYADEKRWITREDFFRLKDTDPYVALCWSFGNDTTRYLYSKEVEPWKRAYHYARVLGDFSLLESMGIRLPDAERKTIRAHAAEIKEKYMTWWLKENKYRWSGEVSELIRTTKEKAEAQKEELRLWLCAALKDAGLTQAEVGRRLGTNMEGHYFGRSQWEFPTREYYNEMRKFMPLLDKEYDDVIGIQRLNESLESLERLQSLQNVGNFRAVKADYRSLLISDPDAVIYADPPYKNTSGYEVAIRRSGFRHDEFYDWCERQTALTIISEYDMPSDRFACVWEKAHRSIISGTANNAVIERLFVPKAHEAEYWRRINESAQPTLFDYARKEGRAV